MVDRRGFIVVGAAAGATALLPGCGGGDDRDEEGIATETGEESSSAAAADVGLLNRVLEAERELAAAYADAVAPAMRGGRWTAVERLLTQERDHVDALVEAIGQLGAAPARRPGRYDFGAARTAAGALALAVHLENRAIAAYLDALPRLTSPDLRGTAASMLTSDAEHLVVLRRELGEDPVPSAFAGGAG
ncbi:MAG TPA: DUF4439 domain-containing protein [Solirubrobacteraceae bacterium]|nr:DUF4439 domain-containing protein [Solirubrobacteraceae bacterium]